MRDSSISQDVDGGGADDGRSGRGRVAVRFTYGVAGVIGGWGRKEIAKRGGDKTCQFAHRGGLWRRSR